MWNHLRIAVIFISIALSTVPTLSAVTNTTAPYNSTTNSTDESYTESVHIEEEHISIHVASLRWSYVRTPFMFTIFVLITGILKIGFHHADKLSSIIPESCLLIILGVIVGAISKPLSPSFLPHFTAYTFFLFLLPPIVLEAAYSLHDRAFLRNVGTILLFAVVGTMLNCFLIGASLYGFGKIGESMLGLSIVDAFVFSALISAVDPVAVLAIFQEIGVNDDLYFLVFGESLLNDAVTVVLYGMMETFTKMSVISPSQYGLGIAAFLTVSLGGLFIGVFFGVITSLLTKFTDKVRVVEPLAFLGIAYFSYIAAELFHLSGIISIIGCGLIQAHYAKRNISSKSCITIKYFTKMLSSISDSIIFLFLGMVLVETNHKWHIGFILVTVILCLICRFFGVYFLTALVNVHRCKKINFEEQFIMAYGGLRGAVSFSLVILLDGESVKHKDIFVTATLVVVIFTVFIQGITIKPLVKLLRIKTQKQQKLSLLNEINHKVTGHMMAGVEEISGSFGDFYIKELFHRWNNKYIKPYLIRSSSISGNLNRIYEKLTLADHYANLYGPGICLQDKKPLMKAMQQNADVTEIVSDLIGSSPAVNFDDQVSDLEVEVRQPSKWARVQANLGKAVSDSAKTATKLKKESPRLTLRRALSNSPYERLHQTYNRNLVNDDDQELDFHLRRRCSNAKRLTSIVLTPPYAAREESQRSPPVARSPSLRPPAGRLDIYNATQLLIDRANASKFRARSSSESTHATKPKSNPVYSRALSLNDAEEGGAFQSFPSPESGSLPPVAEDEPNGLTETEL